MMERLPSGTRDFLPDEMRELRGLTDRLRAVFEAAGCGEVYTPALEYERGDAPSATVAPAYRLFDDHGNVLALRSDMTLPIARLVATRYAHAEPPLRFCYFAHAYRVVRPQRGHSREVLQAGVELVGAPAPAGTAEALTLLCAALDAAGLRDYRIGLGDTALFPALLRDAGLDAATTAGVLHELVAGDLVGVERELRASGLPADRTEQLLTVSRTRGGPEVLTDLPAELAEATAGLRDVHARLTPEVGGRVIFDLGLVRSLGYYTGAVFQVYDPALGAPVGSGGRYDELLGRFGRSLPAVGFALDLERLHIALTGEERTR